MKKFLFFFVFMLVAAFVFVPVVFAQDVENPSGVIGWGVETFAGIVAIVSFILTQGAKSVPFVEKNTFTKIASSIVIAVVISVFVWQFKWASFLAGLMLWQVLIQGVLIGLSACGFYDVLKSFGLMKKSDDD